jgi:hypothetical protein
VIGPSYPFLFQSGEENLFREISPSAPPLEGDAVTTRLIEILDRDAAIMRSKMAEVMPAADGEARRARELMILLHTGLFVIQTDGTSTAEELREFAGQILDRTRITKQ